MDPADKNDVHCHLKENKIYFCEANMINLYFSPVILSIEEKIRADNGNTDSDGQQD